MLISKELGLSWVLVCIIFHLVYFLVIFDIRTTSSQSWLYFLISEWSRLCNVESPFEFRALEVALEAICSFLAARTMELETAAYPALDELTSKVSTYACPLL